MRIRPELTAATRRLRRNPGFTLAALLTLGAGIGATVAMFAVVHGIVLNPLPYPAAGRLVRLDNAAPGIGSDGGLQMTQGLYLLYRESSRTLRELAVHSDVDVTLTAAGPPRRLTATVSTPELASILQTRPALGRFLDDEDAVPGAPPVAVLSHALWRSVLGANPDIVGATIVLNAVSVEVVGVMPADFEYPSASTDLWLARSVNPAADTFGSFTLDAVARLAPGAGAPEARDELQHLIPRLIERFPGAGSRQVVEDARLTAIVTPLRDAIVGNVATTLWVLLGTVGLLLVIAGVNVINLLVVRLEGRQRDVAIRTALGAAPRALAAHFLAEAVWLAGLGGAVGVGVAAVALGLVRRFGPAGLPRLDEVGLTPPVLGVAVALTAGAGLVLGLLPLATGRRDLTTALKGTRTTADRRRFRVRNALIVSQTAFALILVLGAGLMTRSFWHLTHVDTGFDPEGVLTFQIALPGTTYPTRERAVALHDALLERLRALPGVDAVGASTCLPLCGSWAGNPWAREDRPSAPGEIPPIAATRRVSEEYFDAMRLAVLRGRGIERRDREQRTGAAVVNRRAAAKLFPGEDPLGKTIYHAAAPDSVPWYRVVGVVEDAPVTTLTDDPAPIVYLPLLHTDATGPNPRFLSYAVRTTLPPTSLVTAVRDAVGALDAALPIANVGTMAGILRTAGAGMAFTMVLLALAAAMALFLGLVGIYSVIAYMVSLRTAEFGVRLALGARADELARMVLRQGGVMVGVGVVVGLGGALILTRFMRAMVFGVSTSDPPTYAVVTALLGAVAVLAIRGPARRAAGVDPMESLRAE